MNTSFVESIASFNHDHPPIGVALLILTSFSLLGSPVLSTILFPFYFRVSRKNRMRDRETAIFPFINYFCWATCLTEAFFYLSIVLILVNLVYFPPFRIYNWFLAWTVYMLVKLTIALMLNILTAFLALHRSSLYFFPKIRDAITPTGKTAQRLIWVVHFLLWYIVWRCVYSLNESKEEKDYWNQRMLIFQFSLYGFVLLSIFPYFLMILSIQKLTNLTSKAHSKPEQYIKFQILIIIIAKLFIVPLVLSSEFQQGHDSLQNLSSPRFLKHLFGETTMASVTIQVSYLLNNKVNLDTLKTSCCWCKKARVEPYSSNDNTDQ